MNPPGPSHVKPCATASTPPRSGGRWTAFEAIATALVAALALALLAALVLAPTPAAAQALTLDLGDGEEGAPLSGRIIQLFLLITVLSLAPGIAMMITCFPFMVTVLSILRQAIGLQAAPPNMLIVSLALFLTYFVMEPVFVASWTNGVQPLIDGAVETAAGLDAAIAPFRAFMEARVSETALDQLRAVAPGGPLDAEAETPLSVLTPAFMLSEIQRAFEIGFLIFLPFLVIDLVVASVLMAMGMMMVPPAIVSLPFKLAFFVLADGWSLLASALVTGYTG